MNEELWGLMTNPLVVAAARTTVGTGFPLHGTTPVHFLQPTTNPLAVTSLGADLLQTR